MVGVKSKRGTKPFSFVYAFAFVVLMQRAVIFGVIIGIGAAGFRILRHLPTKVLKLVFIPVAFFLIDKSLLGVVELKQDMSYGKEFFYVIAFILQSLKGN